MARRQSEEDRLGWTTVTRQRRKDAMSDNRIVSSVLDVGKGVYEHKTKDEGGSVGD